MKVNSNIPHLVFSPQSKGASPILRTRRALHELQHSISPTSSRSSIAGITPSSATLEHRAVYAPQPGRLVRSDSMVTRALPLTPAGPPGVRSVNQVVWPSPANLGQQSALFSGGLGHGPSGSLTPASTSETSFPALSAKSSKSFSGPSREVDLKPMRRLKTKLSLGREVIAMNSAAGGPGGEDGQYCSTDGAEGARSPGSTHQSKKHRSVRSANPGTPGSDHHGRFFFPPSPFSASTGSVPVSPLPHTPASFGSFTPLPRSPARSAPHASAVKDGLERLSCRETTSAGGGSGSPPAVARPRHSEPGPVPAMRERPRGPLLRGQSSPTGDPLLAGFQSRPPLCLSDGPRKHLRHPVASPSGFVAAPHGTAQGKAAPADSVGGIAPVGSSTNPAPPPVCMPGGPSVGQSPVAGMHASPVVGMDAAAGPPRAAREQSPSPPPGRKKRPLLFLQTNNLPSPAAENQPDYRPGGGAGGGGSWNGREATGLEGASSEVGGFLYVGSRRTVGSGNPDVIRTLRDAGVGLIVNCCPTDHNISRYHSDEPKPGGVEGEIVRHYRCRDFPEVDVVHVHLEDNASQSLGGAGLPYLTPALQAMEVAERKGQKVLVHCFEGLSRSVAVAIAYLCKHRRMKADEAYAVVKGARSAADCKPHFYAPLCREFGESCPQRA